jgi:phosphohistidine phosphatase
MNVLVIRHGIAQERDKFASTGQADSLRPLTDDGIKKMTKAARGLRKAVEKIDLLATSPLTRAMQTAEIVAKAFNVPIKQADILTPGTPSGQLMGWIGKQRVKTVAIVGHEPDLSRFVSFALTGRNTAIVEMKKGSAIMLQFGGAIDAGGAILRWAMTPGQLRDLK